MHHKIGFYALHGYEICLIAKKGQVAAMTNYHQAFSVIFSPTRAPSEKPVRIYDIIEVMVPGGSYLNWFARPHEMRDNWTCVGLQMDQGEEAYRRTGKKQQKKGRAEESKQGQIN